MKTADERTADITAGEIQARDEKNQALADRRAAGVRYAREAAYRNLGEDEREAVDKNRAAKTSPPSGLLPDIAEAAARAAEEAAAKTAENEAAAAVLAAAAGTDPDTDALLGGADVDPDAT
ncbi:MAG: hypothetical protein O7A04_06045 [Acidobacteria bacterium]|nr:hypothetical protein [Acidobacteriota bacterium]